LFFEQGEGALAAVGFGAQKTESSTDGHAETSNGLLIIHNQKPNSEIFTH
jgi:hypothetical protein